MDLKYSVDLQNWLNKQLQTTGRFDQKPITTETPLPVGASSMEILVILSTMITAAQADPSLANEISPNAPDSDKPWGMGRIWCEYENACLINEMAAIRRNHGEWDRG